MATTQPIRREGDPRMVPELDQRMKDYQAYLDNLFDRFPHAYGRMKEFMARGSCSCKCGTSPEECECADSARVCICSDTEHCKSCPSNCSTARVEEFVRVYDIDPAGISWKDFLERTNYSISDSQDFHDLKVKLTADLNLLNRNEFEAASGEEKGDENGIFSSPNQSPCRVIVVNHLSPKAVRLLGGIYDISADFFNRHLPGTEAMSGRLISRLPSTVQIDLDELYEGTKPFSYYFDGINERHGHDVIRDQMKHNFLFNVGWDYFPVSDVDWDKSVHNAQLSSGYEVIMHTHLKNVFQFNLANRISVYSQPPRHKRTGKSNNGIFQPV